jgi:hypothetical protein
VTGSPSCTSAATATSPVGDYDITCTIGSLTATNYDFSFAKGTLTISARPLTITASDQGKIYGGTTPPFTVNYSGFATGEGPSNLNGALVFTFTGIAPAVYGPSMTPPTNAGKYTIAPSGLSSPNYNIAYKNGTYTISYGFSFLQPINYTAHTVVGVNPDTSIFKGGSTIPVKFSLYDAAGNVLPCQGAATFVGYAKGGSVTTGVTESVYTDQPNTGGTFTCSNGMYQFNWSTKGLASGYYYRIDVKLPDGTIKSVYIGLK